MTNLTVIIKIVNINQSMLCQCLEESTANTNMLVSNEIQAKESMNDNFSSSIHSVRWLGHFSKGHMGG